MHNSRQLQVLSNPCAERCAKCSVNTAALTEQTVTLWDDSESGARCRSGFGGIGASSVVRKVLGGILMPCWICCWRPCRCFSWCGDGRGGISDIARGSIDIRNNRVNSLTRGRYAGRRPVALMQVCSALPYRLVVAL
ncbi:hypothetical protein [Corynebacterium ulcerans]|uniref:hypothetical protein n=1 Tax=Corynebacterium ulcerans TaxID=65058 RepID=UPI002161914E|nr:hypothetical protein [Corynebacterium ulcerans]